MSSCSLKHVCNICDKSYKYARNLKRHKLEKHFKSDHYMCSEEKCTAVFVRRSYLYKHLYAVHKLSMSYARERAIVASYRMSSPGDGYYENVSSEEDILDLLDADKGDEELDTFFTDEFNTSLLSETVKASTGFAATTATETISTTTFDNAMSPCVASPPLGVTTDSSYGMEVASDPYTSVPGVPNSPTRRPDISEVASVYSSAQSCSHVIPDITEVASVSGSVHSCENVQMALVQKCSKVSSCKNDEYSDITDYLSSDSGSNDVDTSENNVTDSDSQNSDDVITIDDDSDTDGSDDVVTIDDDDKDDNDTPVDTWAVSTVETKYEVLTMTFTKRINIIDGKEVSSCYQYDHDYFEFNK